MVTAILVLNQNALPLARKIATVLPQAKIYGLVDRTKDVDEIFLNFGDTVRELFTQGNTIIGLCASGILIRTIAPLLTNKWVEPPVLAIASDGSAVVPLLGGLHGANELASSIAEVLKVAPAITTTGYLNFQTTLFSPPENYYLANPEDAKTFISDLLAGATVRLEGDAPWLSQSKLPFSPEGKLTIKVTLEAVTPTPDCLVYHLKSDPPLPPLKEGEAQILPVEKGMGKLAIVGTGPGGENWLSPEVRKILKNATDWVGYKTYLDLVEPLRKNQQRHDSDNRVEIDRAKFALDLAATGKTVAVISSGDPGIYAMAAAVFEVLEQGNKPSWQQIDIQVCPGISAMQAAAAAVGAPLGHDFCAISLSDLLKPWSMIAERIAAAAKADFVIAFYNPVSFQRTWQLEKAKEILLEVRSPDTPVILAKNLGRKGQKVVIKPLGELTQKDADMRTIILIGSSKTRTIPRSDGTPWVYTPRTYEIT